MAVWAIGDLQGCYDELRRLLERVRFDPGADRLWLTGDLVNRGPGSLAALRFVRSLNDAAVVVLGNHDLHLLALGATRSPKPRKSDTLDAVLAAPDRDELLAWLSSCALVHSDAALGWSMVHAGLSPGWNVATAKRLGDEVSAALNESPAEFFASMYGDEPDRWSETLTGDDRLRFAVNCLTRMRFCTADGRILLHLKGPIGAAPEEALPWFRVPGRKSEGERILFGHWSALGYYDADGVVGLDTGCAWGGTLTAFRLDASAPAVQVACPVAAPLD